MHEQLCYDGLQISKAVKQQCCQDPGFGFQGVKLLRSSGLSTAAIDMEMNNLQWPFCKCFKSFVLLSLSSLQPCTHHRSNPQSPRQSLWSGRWEWTPQRPLPWSHEYQNLLGDRPKGRCAFTLRYTCISLTRVCTHLSAWLVIIFSKLQMECCLGSPSPLAELLWRHHVLWLFGK